MDFGLSDDQRLLESSVRGFLRDRAPISRVRELREADDPNDRAIWRGLAELGAAGILVPESCGGSGLALLDAALVAQSLGHAVTPSPFLSTGVIAPVALTALPGADAKTWLEGIAAGELVFGAAFTEFFSVRENAGVALEGGVLRGKSLMAIDAHGADRVLLPIGTDRLAVARADAKGFTATRLATIDATRCTAEIVFDGVEPEAVLDGAGPAIARALDAGRIALAADALGACEAMIEQSVAYAQQRRQFGRAIGSFQAVKHMCAEMIAALEPARSLLWYAAHCFDALPDEAPQMACHVLAHVSEIGREIASTATQVHGGVGWTDEQNLHFWFKRIAVARHLLGGPELLRERAAELQGFTVS
jgi:alkylation response protein AidB-like acyl-CoA dehydrogenase